jgi:hypothetical protein
MNSMLLESGLAESGLPEATLAELGLAEAGPMQRFMAELLTAEGGLIEAIEPEGLEAVVPPSLQRALGVPELCRLGFGATLPEGATRVGIESDWLERCARAMGERGRWNKCVLDASAGLGDPDSVLARELTLDNATFRLVAARPAWTRYLVFDLRYTAISDEKRDGVLRCVVNLATGALPDAVLERITPWLDDAASHGSRQDAAWGGAWRATRIGCTRITTTSIARRCGAPRWQPTATRLGSASNCESRRSRGSTAPSSMTSDISTHCA